MRYPAHLKDRHPQRRVPGHEGVGVCGSAERKEIRREAWAVATTLFPGVRAGPTRLGAIKSSSLFINKNVAFIFLLFCVEGEDTCYWDQNMEIGSPPLIGSQGLNSGHPARSAILLAPRSLPVGSLALPVNTASRVITGAGWKSGS